MAKEGATHKNLLCNVVLLRNRVQTRCVPSRNPVLESFVRREAFSEGFVRDARGQESLPFLYGHLLQSCTKPNAIDKPLVDHGLVIPESMKMNNRQEFAYGSLGSLVRQPAVRERA